MPTITIAQNRCLKIHALASLIADRTRMTWELDIPRKKGSPSDRRARSSVTSNEATDLTRRKAGILWQPFDHQSR